MFAKRTGLRRVFVLLILSFGMVACQAGEVTPAENPPGTAAATEILPTSAQSSPLATTSPTEEPAAIEVNGEIITLASYQVEMNLLRDAQEAGAEIDPEAALDDLIEQTLLAQGAAESGFEINEALIQQRIEQLGLSEQALQDWMGKYGFTPEIFRQTLSRVVAAAWMRDQIAGQVPSTAEQVHARQILLYNSTEAQTIYAQLEAGADFGTLAAQYDAVTLGDLGWFPAGYLTEPELDAVIFALDPGEYSPITETALGFHILQVIEREPQRPLSQDARRALQLQAVRQWLETRKNQSEIIIHLP
jgi:peptidyl-prolyl cis-trans isomerase C